jgi:hypothetical protein
MLIILGALVAFAGEADVLYAYLDEDGGYYDISVSVRHADTGWKHYANWWRVRTVDGRELARRVLAHPHVDEQPFERALFKSVRIPASVKVIVVEAHDLVHGYGGRTIKIDLSTKKGDSYEIKRR